MKRRYIYSVLFGIPGLLLASISTLMFFGMLMGVLWLFVFGDNTWPAAVDIVLPTLLGLVFFGMWAAFILGGYLLGKRREADLVLNRVHVLISATITFLLLAFVLVMTLFR